MGVSPSPISAFRDEWQDIVASLSLLLLQVVKLLTFDV
jgi:hypothetical protein